MRTDDDLFVAP